MQKNVNISHITNTVQKCGYALFHFYYYCWTPLLLLDTLHTNVIDLIVEYNLIYLAWARLDACTESRFAVNSKRFGSLRWATVVVVGWWENL